MKKQAKFGIGIGVIIVAMGFLAWLGYGESKTYYHTIAEMQTLHGSDTESSDPRRRSRGAGQHSPISRHAWISFWTGKGSRFP